MNKIEEIKRRIELKQQLIILTGQEIQALERVLIEIKAGDRVIPENRQPEPASPAQSSGVQGA